MKKNDSDLMSALTGRGCSCCSSKMYYPEFINPGEPLWLDWEPQPRVLFMPLPERAANAGRNQADLLLQMNHW